MDKWGIFINFVCQWRTLITVHFNIFKCCSWPKKIPILLEKINIFVKMWNLGQICKKVYILSIIVSFAHMWHKNCNYLPHTKFRFYSIDFQLTTDFPSKFYVFYRRITWRYLKISLSNKMFLKRAKPRRFFFAKLWF